MKVSYKGGALVAYKDTLMAFDSAEDLSGKALRCITHAHADHTVRVNESNPLMTVETFELLRAIRGLERRANVVELGAVVKVGPARIRTMNAGHILGSCQYAVECDEGTLLFSGDINVHDTLVTRAAEPIHADFMVVEATYGEPSFIFPDREVVYSKIVKWICDCIRDGSLPAFKAYLVGKSQELIKLVNEYLGIPVVVSGAVARVCEVYKKFGLGLSYFCMGSADADELLRSGECVYVGNHRVDVPTSRTVKWAVATGWALKYRFELYDATFPLSSHADFKGLIEHVEACMPRVVYTMHGYSMQLARILERRGFVAAALESAGTLAPLTRGEM